MKTVVGLFDNVSAAQAAMDDLLELGIRRDEISIVTRGNGAGGTTTGGTTAAGTTEDTSAAEGAAAGAGAGALLGGGAGLIASLAGLAIPGIGPILAAGPIVATLVGAGVGAVAGGLIGGLVAAGVPEEEARVYQEGVRRGKTLLTVAVADDQVSRVSEILNRHGAVDVDRAASQWRDTNAQAETVDYPAAAASDTAAASARGARTGDESEVRMPVVEEELQVGTRQVQAGGVRVYSHVTEQPAQEQVTLREEQVHVERRPADRDASGDELAGRERTIEVAATREEAVVHKRPRVVEEVVVRKDVDERAETVQDTVRRKDVEVEPIGGGTERAGRSGGVSFQSLDNEFRRNYESTFARQGYTYEQCRPAYQYGYESRQRYGDRDWSEAEPELRTGWEREHPGTWDRYKEGIRYAFSGTRA